MAMVSLSLAYPHVEFDILVNQAFHIETRSRYGRHRLIKL